jgi:aspartyl/asparaginyl beta-hydroxylase (cupin superfamily)
MKSILRLERSYDVDRLVADLKTAEEQGKTHKHFGHYHDGGWSAIPLVSPGGRVDADALRHSVSGYAKTPILAKCPYFESIVDSFDCPKQRVRLMRLEPGANIHEHRDPGDSWALGQVRLHIPVVTHDEVYFYLDGRRVMMRPGELWYCDFSKPHRIANRSPIARVHFVLDLTLSPGLRKLFPPESLAEHLGNWGYWCRYHGEESLRTVARAAGAGRLRRLFRKPAAKQTATVP